MSPAPTPLGRFALGTVQFGLAYGVANHAGKPTLEHTAAVIDRARQLGVDTLDTAVVYGDSEARLGEVGTTDMSIITKLPPLPAEVIDVKHWVSDQVAGSLSRLRRTSLHGLLLHRPDDLLESRGAQLANSIEQMIQSGLIEKAGVSVYGPDQLTQLMQAMPVSIVQAPFNVLDQRLRDSGWLQRLKHDGVEVYVRSLLLQGLLTMEPRMLEPRFAKWMPVLRAWHAWLQERGLQAAEACVRFALGEHMIDRYVIGCDSIAQLEENARFAGMSPLDVPQDICSSDTGLINPALWPKA